MEFSTRIDILESKVDKLLEMLEQQQPIQKRLDNHITFIESVYSKLKGVISYLSWSTKTPQIESIEDQSV
jgi:hypothetical protein